MKLLMVQGGFGAGGAEKNIAMIAEHRLSLGDEVHIVGMATPDNSSYFDYPEATNLHVIHPGDGFSKLVQFRRLLHIRQTVRQVQPDLIMSFLTKINVLTLLANTGLNVPVLVSERNNPQAQHAHPIWLKGFNTLARSATAIVMQTERARQDLPDALANHTHVIPNPCAPFSDVTLGEGATNMVAVGRLEWQKGFDLLLDAMPEIISRVPDAKLTIFGDGPKRDELERQVQRLGLTDRVQLPGSSARPGAWMQDADVLVFPSRFEGFPNVVAEATVSGLPVVAFDCAYGPREIIRDGENGILVAPEDTPALANAVAGLLTDKDSLAKMRQSAVENRYWLQPSRVLSDWDQVIDQIIPSHSMFQENSITSGN